MLYSQSVRNWERLQAGRGVAITCSFWRDHSACMWRTEGRSGGRKLTQKAAVVPRAGAMGRRREEVDDLQVDLVELRVLVTGRF